MEQFINHIQPYATVITSLLSVAVLGFLVRLVSQTREIYNQRVTLAKEQTDVLEERLKLAKDELKRVENINDDVTKIGASLGVEGFQEKLSTSVEIGDIGDNFSGEIAGRDINKIISEVGKIINNQNQNIENLIKSSSSYFTGASTDHTDNEFAVELVFSRSAPDIRDAILGRTRDGWIFCSIAADIQAFDGAILIFRRRLV